MSLRAWWPLIETIDNKIHGIEMTNASPVFNNNGKLGKCLEVNTTTHLNIPTSIYNIHTVDDTELSYSLWIKIDKAYLNLLITTLDFSTKTKIYNKIIGLAGTSTSSGLGIHIRTDDLTSSSLLDLVYIYSALRTNNNSNTGTVTLINLDLWYHVAVTYDKLNRFKFYINGELVYSKTVTQRTTTASNIDTRSVIIDGPYSLLSSGDLGNVHQLSLKEYYNDIRIYDHALSAMEVYELALGLVLHYKLDNNGLGGKNLLLNTKNFTNSNFARTRSTIPEPGILRVTPTASAAYAKYITNLDYADYHDQYYTVSYDLREIEASDETYTTYSTRVYIGYSAVDRINNAFNSSYDRFGYKTVSTKGEGWNHYSCSFTLPDNIGSGTLDALVNGSKLCVEFYRVAAHLPVEIKNIKLEVGNKVTPYSPAPEDLGLQSIIKDDSGYNNHGTIVGIIKTDTTGLRYSCGTYMNNTGTTNHIECPLLPASTQTVSFWCKSDIANNIFFADANTLMSFGLYKDGNNNWWAIVRAISTGKTRSISNYLANLWNHIVIIKDDMSSSTYKLYINGQEETTTSSNNYFSNVNTKMYLLNRSTNTNYAADASISDFRAYATALSEEDILNLYKTSMIVDNTKNMLSFELIEASSSENINKSGLLNSAEFVENNGDLFEFPVTIKSVLSISHVSSNSIPNKLILIDFLELINYSETEVPIHIHLKINWSGITCGTQFNAWCDSNGWNENIGGTMHSTHLMYGLVDLQTSMQANASGEVTINADELINKNDFIAEYNTRYADIIIGVMDCTSTNWSIGISDVKITLNNSINVPIGYINSNTICAKEFIEY